MITSDFATSFDNTRYRFGWDTKNEIIEYAGTIGKKIFLLTTHNATGLHEIIQKMEKEAETAGLKFFHSNSIEPNPDISSLKGIVNTTAEYDIIIGLGGGSVLDAAKALSVFAENTEKIDELIDSVYLPEDISRKKLMLVPTTSGTGSELSYGAIISDRGKNKKGGFRGKRLAPDIALVDPSLTVSVPKHTSAETGFDIFTHAFESYLSRKSHIHSRMMSLQAISLVGQNLGIVLKEPANRQARTRLSYASSMMGLNLANVGTCLPHRLQYPIGGELPDTSHPQGLGWIYPVWIKRVYPYKSEDVQHAFHILGLKKPENADEASSLIKEWLNRIGLETKPAKSLDPQYLASKVAGNLKTDPIEEPEKELAGIYKEIFS